MAPTHPVKSVQDLTRLRERGERAHGSDPFQASTECRWSVNGEYATSTSCPTNLGHGACQLKFCLIRLNVAVATTAVGKMPHPSGPLQLSQDPAAKEVVCDSEEDTPGA